MKASLQIGFLGGQPRRLEGYFRSIRLAVVWTIFLAVASSCATHSFAEAYRGEINGWGTNWMSQDSSFGGVWKTTIQASASDTNSQFRFDRYGDWSEAWGYGSNAAVNQGVGALSPAGSNLSIAVVSNRVYSFHMNAAHDKYAVLETSGNPTDIASVQDNSSSAATGAVRVVITLESDKLPEERVWVRFSVAETFTNHYFVEAGGSSNVFTANIPGQPADTVIYYYALLSSMATNALYAEPDLCTLRGKDAGETNYSYGVTTPPEVSITAPSNTSPYPAPADIGISIMASSVVGIARVDIYADGGDHPTQQIATLDAAPYEIDWSNVSPGTYHIMAVAVDTKGASNQAATIQVTVVDPPVVTWIGPPDGAMFAAPATITLCASASNADGIAAIDFRTDFTNSLGDDPFPPYELAWEGVGPGTYEVSAVASDSYGFSGTSDVISIQVVEAVKVGRNPRDVLLNSLSISNASPLVMTWDPVAQDFYGDPISIAGYRVYRSHNPRFVPDLPFHSNLLTSTTNTWVSDLDAVSSTTSLYYYVTAVDTGGLESLVFTNLGVMLVQSVSCPPNTSTIAWVALPSAPTWGSASSLVQHLDSVVRAYLLDDTTQSYEVWDNAAQTGTDFSIVGGKSVALELTNSARLCITGRHQGTNAYSWLYATNRFNHHWISLPPHSVYTQASMVADADGAITKIARYDSPLAQYQSWFLLGSNWWGTNFNLCPEEGILLSIRSNLVWRPATPYPQVQLTADRAGGLVSFTASLTASVENVENGEGGILWDLDGDGVFEDEAGSSVRSLSVTNAGVWRVAARVTNSHGFSAISVAQIEGIGFDFSYDSRQMDPSTGGTLGVSFSLSTNAAVTLHVVDSSGTVVRTLLTNASFSAGAQFVEWDGTYSGDTAVSDGLYRVVGSFTVGTNVYTFDPSVSFVAEEAGSHLQDVAISSNFNPLAGQYLNVDYSLDQEGLVTVLITDPSTNIIRHLLTEVFRDVGPHTEYWDGLWDDGRMFQTNGAFQIQVSVSTVPANVLSVVGATPALTAIHVPHPLISPAENPYGVQSNAVFMVEFDLSKAADVVMEVRNEAGQHVRSATNIAVAAGAESVSWDGRYDDDCFVPAGKYVIHLNARDSSGLVSDPVGAWAEVYY